MVNILRKLILTQLFLWFLIILIVIFFETSPLPESSERYSSLEGFTTFYLVVYLINYFFLYKLKSFSRYLLLFLICLQFPLYCLDGEYFLHYDGSIFGDNLSLSVEYITFIIDGMILSLLFFTNLKKEFK